MSSRSDPSIMTLVNPERIEPWHTAGLAPWSWCITSVLARARGGLQDDRARRLLGRLHDGLDLLQVVNVERRHAVAVLGGVIEQLPERNECHAMPPSLSAKRAC